MNRKAYIIGGGLSGLSVALKKVLKEKEVVFKRNCSVSDIDFEKKDERQRVSKISIINGNPETIEVLKDNVVFVSVGSMTADFTVGSMGKAILIDQNGFHSLLLSKIRFFYNCLKRSHLFCSSKSSPFQRTAGECQSLVGIRTSTGCSWKYDIVFTLDYSVRSAQTAVYKLLKINKLPTPIHKGHHNPFIVLRTIKTVFR